MRGIAINNTNSKFLDTVERIGNKFPDPLGIFTGIIAIVLVMTAVFSFFSFSATHPQTSEVIPVYNMLTLDRLLEWVIHAEENVQNFRVLAVVLMVSIATGICEKVGFFSAAIKQSLGNVKGPWVVFGVAMVAAVGNIAGDVAFAIIPAISATLFLGLGRHPLVGLFLGYAVVGGGFGVTVFVGNFDVILTAVSIDAAQLVDPDFEMHILNGYYMLAAATVAIAAAATIVTIYFVEPRFGIYKNSSILEGDESSQMDDGKITTIERRALQLSYSAAGIFFLMIIIAAIPQDSFLRSPEGSLLVNAPLMKLILPILVATFFIPGLVYGFVTKQVRSFKDLATIMNDSIRQIAPFIVIAIIVSQFLYIFNESNLGAVLAIRGAELITDLAVPVIIILVLFFLLDAVMDMFIVSGSAKYFIFGPVFVPMLMQLGIHPAFMQVIHRMGSSMSTHLSPLNAFFPVLLGLMKKYDKDAGMGTVFSAMIPYTIAYGIVYLTMIVIWYLLDLPLGPGISIAYP